jgi:hypothetical protein
MDQPVFLADPRILYLPRINDFIDLLSDPLPVCIANQQLYQLQRQMYVIRDPGNYDYESYADFREISNESGEYQILYNPYATFAYAHVYSLEPCKLATKFNPRTILDWKDEVCVDLTDHCNRGRVGNTQSIFFGDREEAIQGSLNINFDGTVDVCVVDHFHKGLVASSYVTPFRPTEFLWMGNNLGQSEPTTIAEPVYFLFPGWANKFDCEYDSRPRERRKK